MAENRKTVWYIHPKDARTNEAISLALEGLHCGEKYSTKLCKDGKKREMTEAPDYAFVAKVWRSRKSANLSFDIFRSQNNSKPDVWLFPEKPRVTLATLKKKKLLQPASALLPNKEAEGAF